MAITDPTLTSSTNTAGALPYNNPNAGFNSTSPSLSTSLPGTTASGTGIADAPNAAASTGNALNSSLNSAFAPQQQSIMDAYKAAKGLTQQSTADLNTSTADRYGQDISYQQQQDKNAGTSNLEGGRGFMINPGAIVAFQQQADKRVKDLRNQMNDALLNNNATGAKALADLMVNEQTAITGARTAFLNQYFGVQNESRAQQGFQTPEQKFAMDLRSQHPDAGILPGDDPATVQSKITNSPSYKQNIALGAASIKSALASAGLAGAQSGLAGAQTALTNVQAQQQGRILSLLNDPASQQADITGLLNGTETVDDLNSKYSGLGEQGGALVQNLISQAQGKGFNLQSSNLAAQGRKNQVNAATGGNLFSMLGSAAYQGFNAVGQAFKGSPTPTLAPGTVRVVKPDGTVGTIPAAQLPDALKQGYKQQ